MFMTPPLAALLSVKVLLVILNEESDVSMTPPSVALRILLVISNKDSNVAIIPPL